VRPKDPPRTPPASLGPAGRAVCGETQRASPSVETGDIWPESSYLASSASDAWGRWLALSGLRDGGLYRALAVKLDFAAGSLDPGFRGDLIAEASARLPDLQASMKARHAAVIEKILGSAADIDLAEAAIPARDVAVVLLDALTGIAQQDEPPDEFRHRLRQMVNLTVRGLRSRA
jgi:hypothetical protein